MIEFGKVVVSEKAKKYIKDALDSSHITQGKYTKAFENQWSNTFGYKHSVAVSSGTDACLNACLAIYDLKKCVRNKSEIIVPALSYIATSNAVRAAGFIPRFVDVELSTLNIDPSKIEDAINENTVGIMCVHTMGKMCDMFRLASIAQKHDLILIEDSAEAHGAMFFGQYPGMMSHMATFSFYAAHLVCSAEGGMISTQYDNISEILQSTRSHGRPAGSIYFNHIRTGLNSKMNDLEAAVGLADCEQFDETFRIRRHNMSYLNTNLAIGQINGFYTLSLEDPGCINCPHGVSLTCSNTEIKNAIVAALDANQIQWKRNFGSIPTQQPAFADMGYKLGDFPVAEFIGDNGIHIGCHKYLTKDELKTIVKVIAGSLNPELLQKDAKEVKE